VLSVEMQSLDIVGDVSLVLQIAILFLLVLGLPFIRGAAGNAKNLIRHGYSTLAALALHTVLIFLVMIPAFTGGLDELGGLSILMSFTVWSHIILGTLTEVLAVVLVGFWLAKGPSRLACGKWKKWMTPIFVIWVISIVNGALIHLLELL
jgi:hypothetical protein